MKYKFILFSPWLLKSPVEEALGFRSVLEGDSPYWRKTLAAEGKVRHVGHPRRDKGLFDIHQLVPLAARR